MSTKLVRILMRCKGCPPGGRRFLCDPLPMKEKEVEDGLTYELVLDIAPRALSKHGALLPCMRVDHLGRGLPAHVACELHPLRSAWVSWRWPHHITLLTLQQQPYSMRWSMARTSHVSVMGFLFVAASRMALHM